jgi:hypothetical protein
MFAVWSIILVVVTMSLSQHLGDLTGKRLDMPWHTGKFVGLIFATLLVVEHMVGIIL